MAAPLGNQFGKLTAQDRARKSILRALARVGGNVAKGLDKVSDKLVEAAVNGQPWAVQLLYDRVDGKVKQAIEGNSSLTMNFVSLISAPELEQARERYRQLQSLIIDQLPNNSADSQLATADVPDKPGDE